MSDAIDTREAELLAERTEIADALATLRGLVISDPLKVVKSDVSPAGGGGSVIDMAERRKFLQSELERIDKELANLPWEVARPIAIGADLLGSDVGEVVS